MDGGLWDGFVGLTPPPYLSVFFTAVAGHAELARWHSRGTIKGTLAPSERGNCHAVFSLLRLRPCGLPVVGGV